jgi:Pre-mRNA splicing Prp18-interacting factor
MITPFRDFQARQARQGGVGGNEMKITVRNLRIREDTPKYLRNLALDRCTAGTYSFLRISFFIGSLRVYVA